MARVFSGIKPTGEMHLGNYLGAVHRWVDTQPAAGSRAARDHEAIFCVVDLHAMTIPWEPAELTAATRRLATMLVAAGLGGDRSLLFVQSHVRAHAELTWVLNCVASFGELRRMTQFKDKSARQGDAGLESVSVGLFDYPVLMVSDILLYDSAEVPVGDDQRQHVELARDIAIRFNGRFGETFVVPKATFPTVGARVMDLQHPDRKMSKSEDSPQGTILVLDPAKTIQKKIKSAVTDSGAEVRHDREAKPGVSNLIEIYAAVTGLDDRGGRKGVRREAVRHVQGRRRRRRRRVPRAGTGARRRARRGSGGDRPSPRARRRRRRSVGRAGTRSCLARRRPAARPRG